MQCVLFTIEVNMNTKIEFFTGAQSWRNQVHLCMTT